MNVRLPWKLNKHDLPTNFILSKKKIEQSTKQPKQERCRTY